MLRLTWRIALPAVIRDLLQKFELGLGNRYGYLWVGLWVQLR